MQPAFEGNNVWVNDPSQRQDEHLNLFFVENAVVTESPLIARGGSCSDHCRRRRASVDVERRSVYAHVLRTPLTIIGGYVAMYVDGSISLDEFGSVADLLSAEVNRLNASVDYVITDLAGELA